MEPPLSNMLISRMNRELRQLGDPPPGICAWPLENSITELQANIAGPADTVYEKGSFLVSITVPPRYPMMPPKVQFQTPIYHPNIDAQGRICLDLLDMPPKGAWSPSINLTTLLLCLQQLLAHPNPDDGLVVDISDEFKYRRAQFDARALQLTLKHATSASRRPLEPLPPPASGQSAGAPHAAAGHPADPAEAASGSAGATAPPGRCERVASPPDVASGVTDVPSAPTTVEQRTARLPSVLLPSTASGSIATEGSRNETPQPPPPAPAPPPAAADAPAVVGAPAAATPVFGASSQPVAPSAARPARGRLSLKRPAPAAPSQAAAAQPLAAQDGGIGGSSAPEAKRSRDE